MEGNSMMAYLGAASPNFIADSLLYKIKQAEYRPQMAGSSAGRPFMGANAGSDRNEPNYEMESLLREVRLQNEILQKRDQEREEKLKGASTATLTTKRHKKRKLSSSSEEELSLPLKKKPIAINNLKLAEVFDPFQFIPKTNVSKAIVSRPF